MADARDLKSITERNQEALRLRPSIGKGTATTKVVVRGGLTCDIEDGQWKLVADEMPGDGGAGLGPDPGVFGRAALGSCLAMGYIMWAASMEIPIDSVEVVVEADYNAAAMMGVEDASPPGWSAIRYTVDISSPAGEEQIREVIEHADRYSPLLDDFARPVSITRELRINSPAKK
jgi:uncharacterized OsmC-like protein